MFDPLKPLSGSALEASRTANKGHSAVEIYQEAYNYSPTDFEDPAPERVAVYELPTSLQHPQLQP
jgi:hypothetical protein